MWSWDIQDGRCENACLTPTQGLSEGNIGRFILQRTQMGARPTVPTLCTKHGAIKLGVLDVCGPYSYKADWGRRRRWGEGLCYNDLRLTSSSRVERDAWGEIYMLNQIDYTLHYTLQ